MKHVKTNQDLIVGRKYLCRTKPIMLQNGSFSKQEISILHIGEDVGRRYVGPNKFWAYDKYDRIIAWKGRNRTMEEAKGMSCDSEISVMDSEYEENSQALERWDMIGPIPEIKEGLLHALFDYPDFLERFNGTVALEPDGSVIVKVNDSLILIDDVETVSKHFAKNLQSCEDEIVAEHLVIPEGGLDVILTEDKYNSNMLVRFPKGMKMKLMHKLAESVNLNQPSYTITVLHDPKTGCDTLSCYDGFEIIKS